MQDTRNLRVESVRPLLSPAILLEEIPLGAASVANRRRGPARDFTDPERSRRSAAGHRRSLLDPRPGSGARVRRTLARARTAARRRPVRRDARLFREAAHDRRLEGPHQRPVPRRHVPDQRGPARRATAARRAHGAGSPCGTEFLDPITPQFIADLVAGARSARAPSRARCIASWRPVCRCPSVSRTARTARSKSPSTRSSAARTRTDSSASPSRGSRRSSTTRQPGLPRHPARWRVGAELRRGQRRRGGRAPCARPGSRRALMVDCSHGNSRKDYRAPAGGRARRRRRRSRPATRASSAS